MTETNVPSTTSTAPLPTVAPLTDATRADTGRGALTVGIDIPRFGPNPNTDPIVVGRPHWEHAPDSIPLPAHATDGEQDAPNTGAKGLRATEVPAAPAASAPTPTAQ